VSTQRRLSVIWRTSLVCGVFALIATVALKGPGGRVTPLESPLLERVQAIGNLHAVKFTYRDISDFETTREPVSWLASVPGGTEVVHAATRNRATMSYTATVEAGVNLDRAKLIQSATGPVLVLPRPQVYPANVSATVHDVQRGLFWRDQGIAATAIESAKGRIQETAVRQGILGQAETNVRKRLESLASELGTAVKVTFE
jgi:hypothetical protein